MEPLARNSGTANDPKYQIMKSSKSSRRLMLSDAGTWAVEALPDAVHLQLVVLRPCMILWRDIVS